VKGVDGSTNGLQLTMAPPSTDGADGGRTTPNSIGMSDGNGNSSADDAHASANGCKRKLESMQEMVVHVTRFVETGTSRTRDNTIQELHTIIADVGLVGNVSKIRAHKTSTGIKDTFLETFLDWMHLLYKSKSSQHEKQVALDNFKSTLPANAELLSPMW
jgi:leucyl-tRNA synthetase